MAEQRYSVPVEGNRLAYLGRWEFPEGQYEGFQKMHTAAREGLERFNARKAELARDARLTDLGRKEALDKEFRSFKEVRERFAANVVRNRRPQIQEELGRLRGGGQRSASDAAGVADDWGRINWYRSLKGEELARVNTDLASGNLPSLAFSIARLSRESGARPDIIEAAREHAVAPHDRERVDELRQELQAIEVAEAAMATASEEMARIGAGLPSIQAEQVEKALADAGLEKTSDRTVGELTPPKAAELERADGVFDASGGAEETVIVDRIHTDEDGNSKIVPTKIPVGAPVDAEVGERSAPSKSDAA